VIDHTGNSTGPAHDVTVSDVLPPEFTVTGFTATISDGTTSTSVAGNFSIAGQQFGTTTPLTLETDEDLTITLTGYLSTDGTVDAGETVDNTVNLTWDTQPGEDDDQSPYIDDETETDREYTDSADAEFTVPGVEFDKRLTDETDTTVEIGEIISYDLVVTVPEGTTNDVVLTDQIPAGMAFVGAAGSGW